MRTVSSTRRIDRQSSGETSPVSQSSDKPPTFKPYVPDEVIMPELTLSALVLGAVLGIIFGASSLYLVLKVGMTVSASIPVAVLSITLFRLISRLSGFRRATILENNIVQTTGSAGESIAFGVGVTMPAVILLGFDMEPLRVMVVAVLGGVLGILMMIPLRRAFIVKQHGVLKYPEGTACADVLIVGEQGGATARTVFTGFGIAFVYQFLMLGLKFWKETPATLIKNFRGAMPAMEVNPTLLGVGYIIGTRVACIMLAGALLSYFVLVPAICFFGDALPEPIPPAAKRIAEMSPSEIRSAYILYIGAGAVATGGIINLCRALPLIVSSIAVGLRDVRATAAGRALALRRTDQDLPMSFVLLGTLGLVVAIWTVLPVGTPLGGTSLMGAVLIVLFGFLFVTVSSRLTGEIGSSSNPISGMTVATLLLTCLIFLALGWTSDEDRLIAMTVAGVVCVAASNGGTTSQDLKTGFLVGGTPKYQQVGIIVGAISSALVMGYTILVLNDASTVYSRQNLPTPKHPPEVAALRLPEARAPGDEATYYVWQVNQAESIRQGIPRGKYLVDAAGKICYLVDPGVCGRLTHRDDGTPVRKYEAPQNQLMALIVDGILQQRLPWTLVLLGVFIAVVLELSRVPSLPFAVGVYLPLSLSTPVFVGGIVRWVVDRYAAARQAPQNQAAGHTSAELQSEMSPGVLMSTGYIAGGAIAGVLIAFLYFSDEIPKRLGSIGEGFWNAVGVDPEFNGLALVAFAVLVALLLWAGTRRPESSPEGIVAQTNQENPR